MLPFVYFYVRDSDDEGTDTGRARAVRGAKAGALGAVLCAALFLVGLFVRTGADPEAPAGGGWFAALADLHSDGEGALAFVVAVLALGGLLLGGALAAHGLTALPLRVMLGARRA